MLRRLALSSILLLTQLAFAAEEKALEGIQIYEPKRDKDAIIQLWTKNYNTITHARENPDMQHIEENVARWEEPNTTHSTVKTYLADGKPVGFIHYNFEESFLFKYFGPKAQINEIAIDQKYRNKGYGGILVQHALDDCKKKSAQSVSLMVTTYMLGTNCREQDAGLGKIFYGKFGFKPTLIPGGYMLRLKPHPAIMAAHAALFWFKKFKK